VRTVLEDFAPLIEEKVPGLLAYYVLDAENGMFATVTICESQEGLEECSGLASQWMRQYLANCILSKEDVNSFIVEVVEPIEGTLYVGVPKAANTHFPKDLIEKPLGGKEHSPHEVAGGPPLLSPLEVSQKLGMGKSWVYKRLRSGEIPSIKLGHNLKVRPSDLEEYLEKQHYHPSSGEEASNS